MDDLLTSLSLSHLASALATETVAQWLQLSRPVLLTRLKELGVTSLKERQLLANGLAKQVRQGRQQQIVLSLSGMERPPVMIRSTYGLCNQLRVLLSYREACRAAGRTLVLHWQRTAACTTRFCDLFEPMNGCIVIDELVDLDMVQPGLARLPLDIIPATPYTHPSILGTQRETSMWSDVQPLQALQKLIDAKLEELGPAFVAVHVRRTDHMTEGGQKELAKLTGAFTSDESFERFLDAHRELPIYVATDDRATQERFVARYGARIRARTAFGPRPQDGQTAHPASVHRQTPIAEAVVDLFCCVAAVAFKGTYYSSFSDAIMRLRLARGSANAAADDHNLALPDWDPMRCGQAPDQSVALDEPSMVALLGFIGSHHGELGAAHTAWLDAGWGDKGSASSLVVPTGTAFDSALRFTV